MVKAVKVGDQGTDHDGFPPTPVIAGSPDVKFDGVPAARVGDPLAPHDKPKHPPHGRTIVSGSSTVFINGKAAALTGGSISCGGVTIGSGTVNIGDQPGNTSVEGISPILTKNAKWISFRAPEDGSYKGLTVKATMNDGSILSGQFDETNSLTFTGIEASRCSKLELENCEVTKTEASLTDVLLSKIQG
ncbi:type VI secretion system PAAR protein [Enterovibrio norvegicus]|uniref:type VI secretion system PAAR protein n=1 Tax=Enterovibrio norvegicus TaxID=188144 RepID=UPI0024B22D86|nr:type VI secretion system PAAR protein [Enterovibrio norvegicus]